MHKTAKGLLTAVAIGGLMLGFSQSANALVITMADLKFESGAEFTGQISFLDDFSAVAAVSGTLTGYQEGTNGFVGSGSTSIDWVWLGGADFNPSPTQVATFLMDGVDGSNYWNWISFAYDISSLPALILAPGGTNYGFVINVDYNDPMVSGGLSIPTAVPLPGSLALLLSGLAGVGFLGRSRKAA